jgi:TolA-binding protein
MRSHLILSPLLLTLFICAPTWSSEASTSTPIADTKPKSFPDEDKAKGYLAEAEKAYKKYDWNKASQIAHQLDHLTVTPATRMRARDIANGTIALEKLFTELNDNDELFHAYDTHPSLVVLKTGKSTSLAVPIVSLDQQIPVETNPLGWIASQRKLGKVAFMLKGKKGFIATSLPSDTIGEVEAADLPTIIKEKQAEFASRLNRLKNSVLADNALAWYDAGKFAYRNRLDDQVTEMMDQALLLDHNLVRSVCEDKAASLFANVVCHMRNGNQKQADAFMTVLNRRFSDTDQGKQARLFYDGKTSELLAAAKEAEQRRLDEIRERNETRLARAKELNDDKQVQQLKQAIAKVDEPETDNTEPTGPTTTGDEAIADAFFAKGRDLYNQALDFGNTPERDVYYEKAYNELHKARAIYSQLVEKNPNNQDLQMKLLECNKLHYGSIKQRRFH